MDDGINRTILDLLQEKEKEKKKMMKSEPYIIDIEDGSWSTRKSPNSVRYYYDLLENEGNEG